MKTTKFEIATGKSNIDWVGKKVTGTHNGTINIKEGYLIFNDNQLSNGRFVIDTTSIKILDVIDPATNAQFAGHLASDDFFNSKQYPEATLVTTSTKRVDDNNYHVKGELTIKGITHPVAFDAQVDVVDDTVKASAGIVIDRTLYGMKFRSGNFFKDLGDALIYNDFQLKVEINAKVAA